MACRGVAGGGQVFGGLLKLRGGKGGKREREEDSAGEGYRGGDGEGGKKRREEGRRERGAAREKRPGGSSGSGGGRMVSASSKERRVLRAGGGGTKQAAIIRKDDGEARMERLDRATGGQSKPEQSMLMAAIERLHSAISKGDKKGQLAILDKVVCLPPTSSRKRPRPVFTPSSRVRPHPNSEASIHIMP